jgi:hypothetical protein
MLRISSRGFSISRLTNSRSPELPPDPTLASAVLSGISALTFQETNRFSSHRIPFRSSLKSFLTVSANPVIRL